MGKNYTILHCHTMLSNCVTNIDSVTTYQQYVNKAKELGMTALAISEHGSVMGWVKKKLATEEAGLKFIAAEEFYLTQTLDEKIRDNYHCLLIAKNYDGVLELNKLSTKSFNRDDNSFYYVPRITIDDVKNTSDNIIVSTACFKKGSMVLTDNGLIPIENVRRGMRVVNMFGDLEDVNFPTERQYSGSGYSFSLERGVSFECTENHKFLTFKSNNKRNGGCEWIEAKDVNCNRGSEKHCFLFPVKTPIYNGNVIVKKEDWNGSFSRHRYLYSKPHKKMLKDVIEISPEIMRMFGLFLGDGHISLKKNPRIGFTFNQTEFNMYWDSFFKIASDQIGIKWNIRERPKNHRIDVYTSSVEVVDLFYWIFGDVDAGTKYIPQRIVNISREFDIELVFGYMLADGYFRMRHSKNINANSGEFVIASISKRLIDDVKTLLSELHIKCQTRVCKSKTDKNGVHHKESYYLWSNCDLFGKINKLNTNKHDDIIEIFNKISNKHESRNYILYNDVWYEKVRIKYKKGIQINETVYCLNNNTHSFICNGVVVHNCLGGVLNKAPDDVRWDFYHWLCEHKDRCFLEIQPHLDPAQKSYNNTLWALSKQSGLRLLMCTDTHALNSTHVDGRRILQKAKNIHFDGEDRFHLEMMSYDELVQLCRMQDALPMDVYLDAIEMTNTVADMVEPFELDYSYKYPHLWGDDSEAVLRAKIANGIVWRGVDKLPNYQEYLDRIEYEMKAYIHNGAIDFMLLMEDIVAWCRTQDIQIGYGRGSCTGSLIAYLLGITEMDSIKHKLNFDRFMNVERVSLSDIDSDIPPNRIDEVKNYVFNKHGLYCADIVTFNTIALKGAIRDVGRALEMPLDEVADICNKVEQDEGGCRAKYPELFKYVDIVNGCVVSVGNHPSGMIVAPHSIDDRMGLFTTTTDTVPISQINMKEVDLQNYVKLDLLKLITIQIINETCKMCGIERLTPDNIDVADNAVWRSIRDDTTAIFQWESGSARQYIAKLLSDNTITKLRKVQPDIDYITLLSMGNGAIRPAGASYRDELANGDVRTYDNQAINHFMSDTFGFLIFQCQIIGFLHKYCGYTMGEADVVRRHFAKKTGTDKDIPQIKAGFAKTMAEQYGMSQEQSDKTIANFIQVIEDASNYLFSLNHSQPYSYEGYAEGWLRYYYPLQFLTVCLNVNQGDDSETAALTTYAHKMGIKIKSPRFRHSRSDYFCDTVENVIYKGLGSIKYMSADVAEALYNMRDQQFKNFIDVLFAIQQLESKPDSRQLDILVKIGYFDEFGPPKALLLGIEIFNKFYKYKTIKLDKWREMGYNTDMLAPYAGKMTDKTASQLDNRGIVLSILRSMKMPKTTIVDRLKWQSELLGYVDACDPKSPITDWLVLDVKTTNYGTVYTKCYNLCLGAEREFRANRQFWAKNKLERGDVIRAVTQEKNKMKKNENGEWVKLSETYCELKCWSKIE